LCAHQSNQQLSQTAKRTKRARFTVILQFCSRFELHDRDLGELHVTAEIVGVEDLFDIGKL
jgi:hypothetical protein